MREREYERPNSTDTLYFPTAIKYDGTHIYSSNGENTTIRFSQFDHVPIGRRIRPPPSPTTTTLSLTLVGGVRLDETRQLVTLVPSVSPALSRSQKKSSLQKLVSSVVAKPKTNNNTPNDR